MIDERIDALIQMEIDGALTEAEARELETILRSDPRARAHREELRGVVRTLASVRPEVAPAALKPHVLNSLDRRPRPRPAPSVGVGRNGFWSRVASVFQTPRYAAATAFAAGVLVTVGALGLSEGIRFDSSSLSGSIAPGTRLEGEPVLGRLDGPGFRGEAVLERREAGLALVVRLQADHPVPVRVEPQGEGWETVGIQGEPVLPSGLRRSGAGWTFVHDRDGEHVFLFQGPPESSRIQVAVQGDGETVLRILDFAGGSR